MKISCFCWNTRSSGLLLAMILPYGHCCQDTKTLTLVNKYTRKDSSSPPTSRRRRRSSFLYLRCVFLSRYNFTPPHFQSNSAHATHARENVKSPKNATPPTQFPHAGTLFLRIVIHTTNSSPESEWESFINPNSQSAFFWPSSTTTHSSSRDTHTSAAVFAVRFLSSFVVLAARLSYVKNATQKIAWTENSVKSHALLFPRFTFFLPNNH